jgi:hypothetical protein
MLVMGHELNEPARTLLEWLSCWRDHLKVDGGRRAWGDGVNLPCRRLSDTDLCFTHAPRFLPCRNSVTNETRHFKFLRRLHTSIRDNTKRIREDSYLYIERRIEPHEKESLIILVEQTQKTLLEDGSRKRIGEYDDTIGRIWQGPHLQQTNLIETSSKQVDRVTVVGRSLSKTFIKL